MSYVTEERSVIRFLILFIAKGIKNNYDEVIQKWKRHRDIRGGYSVRIPPSREITRSVRTPTAQAERSVYSSLYGISYFNLTFLLLTILGPFVGS